MELSMVAFTRNKLSATEGEVRYWRSKVKITFSSYEQLFDPTLHREKHGGKRRSKFSSSWPYCQEINMGACATQSLTSSLWNLSASQFWLWDRDWSLLGLKTFQTLEMELQETQLQASLQVHPRINIITFAFLGGFFRFLGQLSNLLTRVVSHQEVRTKYSIKIGLLHSKAIGPIGKEVIQMISMIL